MMFTGTVELQRLGHEHMWLDFGEWERVQSNLRRRRRFCAECEGMEIEVQVVAETVEKEDPLEG